MADDDEEYVDYAAVAGFCTTPPSSEDEAPHKLDASELRASLTALAELQQPRRHVEAAPLPQLSEDDILRHYDSAVECVTLLVSFGGLAAGMGGHPAGVARHEFVGTARRVGASHALFLKDPEQAWYLRGGTDTADAYAGVTALVAQEVQALRPRRLVLVGASMGGYAAIRVGLALGADVVLAFGPQVFIDPAERAALDLPHAFFDAKLRALEAAGVPLRPSLVALVSRRSASPADGGGLADGTPQQRLHRATTTTRLMLHVGGNCSGDVTEAALLQRAATEAEEEASAVRGTDADAPRDGAASGAVVVEVTVHRRCGHAVASRIRAAGKLDPLLRRCIGVGHGEQESVASQEAAGGVATSTESASSVRKV